MGRLPVLAAALVCLLAGACTTKDDLASTPTTGTGGGTGVASSATGPPALTAPPSTVATGDLTLTATDVRLVNSEESDNGLRMLVDSAAAELSVTLTGVPSPNRVVTVCPAAELDRHVTGPGCVTPASGETVQISHQAPYRGVEIVQVGVAGDGPTTNSLVVGQISVRYRPTSREIRLRLAPLAPGEAAGNRPAFRLSPASPNGQYRAVLNWPPPAAGGSGTAELALVPGTTGQGTPLNTAQGGPQTQITGNLSPPADTTLRVRNTGSVALLGVTVNALLP